MMRWALGLLLLGLPIASAEEPSGEERLPFGEQVERSLGPEDHPVPGLGAARVFRVAPDRNGPITLRVGSVDGDVILALLRPDGTALAQNDDGGVETDARLVVPGVTKGEELRVLAAFKVVREGRLVLSAHPGVEAAPSESERAVQSGRWRVARGSRRLDGGDLEGACEDFLEGADLFFTAEYHAEVVNALTRAEPLLDEYADPIRRPYGRAFLASSLFRLGRLEEAQPRLEAAAIEARADGVADIEMLVVSDLGKLLAALGESEVAEVSLKRGLELSRQLDDRGNELVLHTEMARLLIGQRRLDEARVCCEAAEALAAELDEPARLAEALATRAQWHSAAWDLRSAETALERAVLLTQKPASRANLLGELGDLRRLLDDPRGAAHAYWQASQIAAELDDIVLIARTLIGLGYAYLALDEPLAARESLDAALVHLALRDFPRNRVICLSLRSVVLSRLDQPAASLSAATEARELAETLGDPLMISYTISALRHHYELAGDLERSETITRELLAQLQEAALPIESALVRADLAAVHFRRGRLEDAEQEALAALAEFEAMGLARERLALQAASVLTEVALRRQDLALAEERMGRLADIGRRMQQRSDDAHAASAVRAGTSLGTVAQLAHDLTALRVQRAADPEALRSAVDEGLRKAGRWKGLELATGLQSMGRGGGDAGSSRLLQGRRRLLAERDGIVSELLIAVTDGRPEAEIDALADRARELDDRAQQIAVALAAHSPRDAALENLGRWGLAELRESLRTDEIYVEFVEGRLRLYSFVVDRESATMHDLGPLMHRREEVNAFVAGLSRREHLADAATVARSGAAVWRSLLGPAFPGRIPVGARLVVVPSSSVAMLPFEALVLASDEHPSGFEDVVFLLDRHEVVYASSGPVFAALQSIRPRAAPGRALVLGDPIYEAQAGPTLRGTRDPRSLNFTRLPGTRSEALGLARALLDATGSGDEAREALDLRQAGDGADAVLDLPALRLVLGRDLTPDVLQGDLREFGLIHCATHGHMDVHDPGLTGLALTPSESDDGFVTATDVLELSLDADLAVLSACETARGRERRGEGTLSLSRAFLYAGARSVVSSMWQVDDRETERTMEVFYDGVLRDGQTVPTALREARLAIRHGKAAPDAYRGLGRGTSLGGKGKAPGRADLAGHPYFWAPFVYVGPTDMRLGSRPAGEAGK